jgi:GAF domain-containing protein
VDTTETTPEPETMAPGLAPTLRQFARALASGYDIVDVLHDLTSCITEVLGVAGAGVSLLRGDLLEFATCDTERLAALERVQDASEAGRGEGPCVAAAQSGEAVLIGDLAEHRVEWPAYVDLARRLGIEAVAAVPLCAGGVVLGTVELYAAGPHAWTGVEVETAEVFADVAAAYVRNASELERERRTNEQLQRALDSRVVIEQAKGIIAAQRGVTVDVAFQILRRHANDRQATLRAVAEAVVSLGLRL